jgi:predicted aldo/keto reductase-like oxidoreductase
MAGKLRTIDLGRSGLKVTELGCGGIPIMRVNLEEAKRIIKRCFELGIRFYDTAHVYGDSEEKLGSALEPVRDEVVLATKVWAKDAAGAAKELAMSFERLRTKRIDLIQCHNVSNQGDLDRVMGPGGAYEALAQAKAEDKVGAIGFSSHNPDIAVQAIHTGKFTTLQFPFNFIEDDPQEKVFPAAREWGMGLIAMKPLGGGLLDRADLCFRFLQQYPDVVPIPGVQSLEEINEIVGYYRERLPLGQDDREQMQRIRNELGGRFCHRCEYCMPCQQGVQIPKVLLIKSQVRRFSPKQLAFIAKEAVASVEQCAECGECVEKCPYHLPVPEMLKENAETFKKFMAEHGLNLRM